LRKSEHWANKRAANANLSARKKPGEAAKDGIVVAHRRFVLKQILLGNRVD
jgi:hypothetical protein